MPLLVPQAIGWALSVLGAAMVGRLVGKQWRRVQDGLHPHHHFADAPAQGRIPALRLDPQSGVYRPE